MARSTTPTFVTEVELLPTGKQAKKLRSKFEAARQVYNACLGETLKRLRLMRESKAWQNARKLKAASDPEIASLDRKQKKLTKQRISEMKAAYQKAFSDCQKRFRFSEFDLSSWTTQFTTSWINEHIGAKTVAAVAQTAWKAVERYLYDPKSKRPPRFRRKGDLRAVDGRTQSCCHWKGDHIVWKGMKVPAVVNLDDPVIQYGLKCDVKYVRVVRKVIRGKERFFAQLVCEGEAYKKESHRPNSGIVGIDIGTQTIAVVGETDAFLKVFCAPIDRDHKLIRRIQRAMDRSGRSTNPDNFDEKGSIKKGSKLEWTFSKQYGRLKTRLANLLRKEADHRKNLHGQMVAEVLQLGSVIKAEKLNIRSWAKKGKRDGNKRRKRFGKSIASRAPGMFLSRLKKEAEKWKGELVEFSTRTTKLSQTCHCGNVRKKSLGNRVHDCPLCGVRAQRDLYSAFLARFVEKNTLHADEAQKAWSDACMVLETAWDKVKHANGIPSSLGLRERDRAACLQNGEQNVAKMADDVPVGRPTWESRTEGTENRHNTSFFEPNAGSFSEENSSQTVAGNDGCDQTGADTG